MIAHCTVDEIAREFGFAAIGAIAERGRFIVALSGGSTPVALHGAITERYADELDWSRVFVVFGDDRFVPETDAASNYGMAKRTLLDRVGIPTANVLPMYREGTVDAAAQAYERQLSELLHGAPIDLVYLGIGADGHTLSLFPGEPGVHETHRSVIAARAPVGVAERITLTVPPVLAAQRVAMLAYGEEKRPALTRCLYGPVDVDVCPSQAIVRYREVDVFTDFDVVG